MSNTEGTSNHRISGQRISGQATKRPAVEILRQIHRWIALVLVLFIFIIGLTGATLQGIMAVYGEAGPGGVTLPPNVAAARQLIFKIHTGFLIGLPGAYYGLICGLGLLFFSLSGLWMYLTLHQSRAAIGRKGLFWATKTGEDATVRSLHRWFTVAFVLFTSFISFTGASLDFDFVRNNSIPGGGPRAGGGGPGGPGGAGGPGGPGGPGGGPGGPGGAPPGGGGAPGGGAPPPSGAGWHMANFNVHKMDFLGTAGHYIGVVVGLGLAGFAITGFLMYLAMHARRAKAGQKGLFW